MRLEYQNISVLKKQKDKQIYEIPKYSESQGMLATE